ncbi:MAG: toxin HicA [Desulfobacterium sp.]
MKSITEKLKQFKKNPKDVKFSELCKVCDFYFGDARQSGSSHKVYKIPWRGDPRVNVHNSKGKAKAYQVRQVLKAIERLEVENGLKK